jgi:hypothetical protein
MSLTLTTSESSSEAGWRGGGGGGVRGGEGAATAAKRRFLFATSVSMSLALREAAANLPAKSNARAVMIAPTLQVEQMAVHKCTESPCHNCGCCGYGGSHMQMIRLSASARPRALHSRPPTNKQHPSLYNNCSFFHLVASACTCSFAVQHR